ncbi:MAG: hypothetical protein QOI62_82 [Solirubrobacteraceae bacterium]|jgi:hypothetical protein|nr:hypothetical protein [Solirubrobacteraceae bacterium]
MWARVARHATSSSVLIALVATASASAAIGLPAGGAQVNDDPADGIDPAQSAGVSDVVGGSLVAGGPRVPWATFEQAAGGAQRIFVRAFKNGQWVTQGPALNIDPNVEAEAPSIDFAGTGRTVPWDAWYEPNAALGGQKQIFASRFVAPANAWQPEGQARAAGVPSLNIHVAKEAENPAVAGGAAVAGNDPVPWVAWQEQDGSVNGAGNHAQIFVSKGVKQAAPTQPCAGFKPSAAASVSLFCWQQVGLDRLAPDGGSSATGDPTLDVDPSRNGIEPDVAFTGPSDTVAWVVWYETGPSALALRANEQVFAARIVANPAADGAFAWRAVGNGTAGQVEPLDTSGPPNAFGPCATAVTAEDACSLNKAPANDGEDPRVAAGTLTPGSPTVPWVTWAEDVGGGRHAVFVSRLVAGDHFELFNGGDPVSGAEDATHPDITFFGNVPYVSWIVTAGGVARGFVGHFDATGAFLSDTPGGIRLVAPPDGPAALIDFRAPISSSCTADPFTADGANCPVAAVNAPFFLFTTAATPQRLFAQAAIGGPNCAIFAGCQLTVSVGAGRAVIRARLRQRHTVGILVERVVGRRQVHGRSVLRVAPVGRVPLGTHRRGQLRLRWNLRVRGRPLRAGRYRITLRALDRRDVLGVTRSVTIRVR